MTDTHVLASHLNVNCLDRMLEKPRLSYDWLRFDSNNDCNLHCVYCHNSRSKEQFDLSVFTDFLRDKVSYINNFQFGCRMEPTLDRRLVDFIEALHRSPARPKSSIVLQTNGILLHRHDGQRMLDVGLTDIQVSIDTLNEKAFAELRGGAKIGKILRNIREFAGQFPTIRIKFIVTVAKTNLPHVVDLVEFAASVGVASVVVREMFHIPGGNRVDDSKMAKLVLSPGEFSALTETLADRLGDQVHLNCIDAKGVNSYNASVQSNSY